MKKLIDKYEGTLTFKYFNCGKIGHFVAKCPYAKSLESDEQEVPMKEKK